jgi:hypothetical protein
LQSAKTFIAETPHQYQMLSAPEGPVLLAVFDDPRCQSFADTRQLL